MREFALEFREAFKNGLRPFSDTPAGASFLKACYNMKPTARGLVVPDVPSWLTTNVTQTSSYPFPQVWRSLKYSYIAQVESSVPKLYEMTHVSDPAINATIASGTIGKMENDGSTTHSLTGTFDTQFDIVQYDEMNLLVNNKVMISNSALFSGWRGLLKSGSGVTASSMTQVDTRVFFALAASSSSAMTTGIWPEVLTEWRTVTRQVWGEDVTLLQGNANKGDNWIMWSTLGGGDIDLPFALEMSLLSGYKQTELKTAILDAVRNKQIGFIKVPSSEIRKIMALGDRVMVYSDNHVGFIAPEGDEYRYQELAQVGLMSRAVGGSDLEHIFLEQGKGLWRLSASNFQPFYLGFQEYLSGLTNPVVSYHRSEDDYYISDASNGFILTRTGLGKTKYRLLSVYDSSTQPLAGSWDTTTATDIDIVTHDLDMKRRAHKTLQTVEVGLSGLTGTKVGVEYRYSKADSFTRTTTILLNTEGVAFPVITAPDLRLVITGTPGSNAHLDYASIDWKSPDRRPIRGLAIQPGQSK